MVYLSNQPVVEGGGAQAGLSPAAPAAATVSGSLGRGLHLLAVLAEDHEPLGLSDLAVRAGFDKATTHRLARTLVHFGYLSQDATSRRYRLGVRVLDLGFAYLSRLDVREQALPFMHVLVREFSESVSLSILDSPDVVYIERVRAGNLRVGIEVHVGSRIPAYCSSMGKALLAWLPPAQTKHILASLPLVPLTPNTITNPIRLDQELAMVRQRGFAINDEEMAFGLRSAAAAIRDRDGWPIAALNAAVATARVTREELETRVGPRVAECAAAISAQLGFNQGDQRSAGSAAGGSTSA